MNWARLRWEIKFALGQMRLASKHSLVTATSLFTFNVKNLDKRCDAELDAYVEKMEAERPH